MLDYKIIDMNYDILSEINFKYSKLKIETEEDKHNNLFIIDFTYKNRCLRLVCNLLELLNFYDLDMKIKNFTK